MEHDEQAERLEREADRMERESERVGEEIDDTRRRWEARKDDPAVPGAQPEPDEDARDEATDGERHESPGGPDQPGGDS